MYDALVYITLLMGMLPFGIYSFKGNLSSEYKAVASLISLYFLASLYEIIASCVLKVNVKVWFQVYSFLEFGAIFYLFKNLITKRLKGYFLISLSLFLVLYLYSFYFFSNEYFMHAKALNKSFLTVFIIASSFIWVEQVFEQKKIIKLYNESSFYFVMGLLIYYSTTISLFVLANSIANSSLYFFDYWLLNIISSLVLRLIILIGVWKMK